MNRELEESFGVGVGVRHGCVMLVNSIILPTQSYASLDKECSTAGLNKGSGNELLKRYMWNVKMGP